MTGTLLRIAVVGHTNTGKTSLLRTLTRDSVFGAVADSPGTTRHVEGARLSMDGRPVLEWFDTPGMEDSIALLDYLDRLTPPAQRLDGPDRIKRFLDSPEAHRRFEQEARVLRKLLDCDAALYVIDARDPVLAKHRDELALLAACGKPLLPVLNFVNDPACRAGDWREAMARLGLHAQVEFDTVLPAEDGETQIYTRLAILLDRHAPALNALAADLASQRRMRHQAALSLAAELLVDAAALRLSSPDDPDALAQTTLRLRDMIRQREQSCAKALLALYNFRRQDYAGEAFPLEGHRWSMDLFHPHVIKDMGVQLGMGVAAGAMAGAAIDLFTGGISLGAVTLTGAAAGGLWQGVEKLGKRVVGKVRGWREISAEDSVLRLLGLRQRLLIQSLERRGHAATQPVTLDQPADDLWRKGLLPAELKEARSRPEWSAMHPAYTDTARRKRAVRAIAENLDNGPKAG